MTLVNEWVAMSVIIQASLFRRCAVAVFYLTALLPQLAGPPAAADRPRLVIDNQGPRGVTRAVLFSHDSHRLLAAL